MNRDENPYQSHQYLSGAGDLEMAYGADRLAFIRRTYGHLAGAVAGFIGIEAFLLSVVPDQVMLNTFGMIRGWGWLLVLGAFMAVSWVARMWAESDQPRPMQYLGLGLYVVAEAVVFLPILFIASRFMGSSVIPSAGLITGLAFAGLTGVVFFTKADLGWMGKFLCIAGFVAMGVAVCSILFGFNLGVFFTGLMVALAAGYIAYDTSNVLHHYNTNQHVAAALALFASVALLFWYVLRLVMAFSSDD